MTEGNHASGHANARPDAIELSFIHADLAASIARVGILVRFGASEQSHLLIHKGAARDVVLARWQQANAILIEALAELGSGPINRLERRGGV